MELALFDLDNTLLRGDSDHAWAEFLVTTGVLEEASFRAQNDAFMAQYDEGTLNIDEFLAFQLKPLKDHPKAILEAWRNRFLTEIVDLMIKPSAHTLVDHHRREDTIIAIVTATNRFITEPIAKKFNIEHLVATELEEKDGQYTGKPLGTPSFQSGKIDRLQEWLTKLGRPLESFEKTYFYSDSINDLPLLSLVTHPVTVNPDAKLKAIALEHHWPILQLT